MGVYVETGVSYRAGMPPGWESKVKRGLFLSRAVVTSAKKSV